MRWDKLCRMHPATIAELQDFKLRHFIRKHVAPFSPHYRAMFEREKIDPRKIRGIADLRRLPFTTKADLITKSTGDAGYRDFILQPSLELIKKHWSKPALIGLLLRKLFTGGEAVQARLRDEYKPVQFTATTGRSAEQVLFFYTPYDIANWRVSGKRILHVVGGSHDTRVINMFPYAPHLAYWQTYYAGLAARALAVGTGGGKVLNTLAHVKLLARLKADMIVGVPSYLYHVLRTAAEDGADLSSIRKVVLGAEKVPTGMKSKMVEMLAKCGAPAEQVRIMGTYGFTEAKRAWAEAPTPIEQSSGYFTYPDLEIFEVINPQTGEVVGDGESGELVYTSLDARGSVVLRYRTGDVVEGGMVVHEPCPFTGWRVPRIRSTIGRVSNQKDVQLTKVKGTLVNLDAMSHVLMASPEVEEWAVEIRKINNDFYGLDELVLYVAARDGHHGCNELKKKLGERLAEASEISPNVIIYESRQQLIERIGLESELKEKRFNDTRPKEPPK